MGNEAVLLKCTEEIAISKTATPEFYLLYQQSVLLSLKEQSIINEIQFQLCLDALAL